MNSKNSIYRYLLSVIFISAMGITASLLQEREIIFPELAALVTGWWIIDKRVWRINARVMIILMSIAACAGIMIVRISSLPLPANLILAFALAATMLTVTRTSLTPLISACMLPVLIGTQSYIYPLAVCVMTAFLAGGQILMVKAGIHEPVDFIPVEKSIKERIREWTIIIIPLTLIISLFIYSDLNFCIVPPLIVMFTEIALSDSGFSRRPFQIFLMIILAAICGCCAVLTGLSPIVSIPIVCIAGFSLFQFFDKPFAPAAAILLVPFILPTQESGLQIPLQICAGAAILIPSALICSRIRRYAISFQEKI